MHRGISVGFHLKLHLVFLMSESVSPDPYGEKEGGDTQ